VRHLCLDPVIVLCMTADERSRWDYLDWQARKGNGRPSIPCVDCTPEFANKMLAKYRCNGYPGMTSAPRPPFEPRRGHPQPLAIRQERRRASWRAYRARCRAKAKAT
jgi:hypothetical protein